MKMFCRTGGQRNDLIIKLCCLQIVDGMCFVASKGIVHGDLRARNILLALPKLVKISNFECALDLQKEQVKRSKKSLLIR